MGDRALARGDHGSAAHALRRGMELARREYLKGDADVTDDTLSIFARKLGEALVGAGDYAEAEGVLREGLGVALNESQEWIRLQCVLGRAYFLRGRHGASESAFAAAAASPLFSASRTVFTSVRNSLFTARLRMVRLMR